ncbi:TSC22 domain family protein 2 isoform X2 [Parasteatoda tepidariorum]|uniref:TSC22 domain family protein 2 isoform X2 n=1 Tax=Parasteatoda tepidariorum TaxID=114398 RepID=UPI001C71886B|nr:TSC22 domain family protein 2 isoform X2 [Parasteatoda tepidariorum]
MHLAFYSWLLLSYNCFCSDMGDNRNTGNCNDSQPYVVGILSPSTTLYIDQMPSDNGNLPAPPTDLNLSRRNTNSFQITSVTVQGSRKNEDFAYDSADDLDESHTDDLSSDFLDSSRADNEGYHSEDFVDDLQSPCGPIIFAQLPTNIMDRNMNLSLGVTPTYTAIGPVAGGVTMMTSKSESPISAQVPIMNPLPNNWQRRFKVVKIMSSEPFKRGRWICMDFKDPPTDEPSKPENQNGTVTPPTIQITNCDPEGVHADNYAQVYEIPINQTFSGNFVMGTQHMYGIILPQADHLQPVTLIQDMSLQTTGVDQNFNNNLVNNQSIFVQSVPADAYANAMPYPQPVAMVVNNGIPNQSPPQTAVYDNAPEAVLNQSNVLVNNIVGDAAAGLTASRVRTNSESKRIELANHVLGGAIKPSMPTEETERASAGLLSRIVPSAVSVFGANDCCCSPPPSPKILAPVVVPMPPPIAMVPPTPIPVVSNTVASSVVPIPATCADINSSQTAPEKIPSEVGQEVDPSTGSAAPTGANTVAIDNKIEQAMDLVKSHLMFAVREEVEVLKEKITELLERISQLEHENDILRANASAETLMQLNNQFQKKPANGGPAKQQPVATVLPSST